MDRIKAEASQTIYDLVSLIEANLESEIVIEFSGENPLYENSSNLQILKRIAGKNNKKLKFDVTDPKFRDYIDAVNNDYVEYTEESVEINSEGHGSSETNFFSGIKFPEFNRQDTGPQSPKKFLKGLIIGLTVLVLLAASAFATVWYVPVAKVKLHINSEVLVKLLEVKAVTDTSQLDESVRAVEALLIKVSETDSQTIPTTGKKEIGEKAKGEVTLFNKTDKDIEIDKGTVIKLIATESDSLQFTIREDAKVGKKKEKEDGSGTEYGTTTVDVEAASFGDDYNLNDGQKFEVGDYDTDELVAENRDSIDGGSSEEVNMVTQADLDNLRRDLENFMKEKVASSLGKKVVTGQVLSDSSIGYEIVSATYSHQLDEEADELTLTLSVKGTGLAYDEKELDELVVQMVNEIIPEGNELNDEVPEYEVAAVKSAIDSTALDLQVKVRSYVTPKLDTAEIQARLTGMRFPEAQEYLRSLPNVNQIEIELSPRLPDIVQTMPHVAGNIEIEILR